MANLENLETDYIKNVENDLSKKLLYRDVQYNELFNQLGMPEVSNVYVWEKKPYPMWTEIKDVRDDRVDKPWDIFKYDEAQKAYEYYLTNMIPKLINFGKDVSWSLI